MVHYIDKDALVAELNKRKLYHIDLTEYNSGYKNAIFDILSLLDTIEVKGVNLNNEYIDEVYSHIDSIKDTAYRMTSGNFMHNKAAITFSANIIVEVLELMGIKAKKGE